MANGEPKVPPAPPVHRATREILVLLEEGVAERWARLERGGAAMSRPLQVALWKELAGGWDDDRSTEEIISDIRASRTGGREFSL